MFSYARIKIFFIECKYSGINKNIFQWIQVYFLVEYKYFLSNKNMFYWM